ncbi:copper resistance CopC family protein [Nonomuraea sp. NPDC049607]|uniref:copper resistance CopC family protein n=1 Tax=unclassified Nonomuraea TaxID=2593643 RepID=UPI00341A110F
MKSSWPVRLASLACAALLAVLPSTAALAHDALKSSSPAKNAQLATLEQIELEFNAHVQFPFVVLHDAAGKAVEVGKPRLDGPKVFADVPRPPAPGSYVIAWRVVSSDGHPIEGEIPFVMKGSVSQPAAAPSTVEEPPAATGVPGWIWGGLAVLVVLGAFLLIRGARRGPDREDVDAG